MALCRKGEAKRITAQDCRGFFPTVLGFVVTTTIIPATPLPHSAIRKKVVMMAFRVIAWLDFIVSWFAFMIARHDFCISCFEINLRVVAESLWI